MKNTILYIFVLVLISCSPTETTHDSNEVADIETIPPSKVTDTIASTQSEPKLELHKITRTTTSSLDGELEEYNFKDKFGVKFPAGLEFDKVNGPENVFHSLTLNSGTCLYGFDILDFSKTSKSGELSESDMQSQIERKKQVFGTPEYTKEYPELIPNSLTIYTHFIKNDFSYTDMLTVQNGDYIILIHIMSMLEGANYQDVMIIFNSFSINE